MIVTIAGELASDSLCGHSADSKFPTGYSAASHRPRLNGSSLKSPDWIRRTRCWKKRLLGCTTRAALFKRVCLDAIFVASSGDHSGKGSCDIAKTGTLNSSSAESTISISWAVTTMPSFPRKIRWEKRYGFSWWIRRDRDDTCWYHLRPVDDMILPKHS